MPEPPGSTWLMLGLPSTQTHAAPAHLQDSAAKLRKQDREGGKNRSWRREYRLLAQQVVALEEDEKALEVVYPQVHSWTYHSCTMTICSHCTGTCSPLLGSLRSVCGRPRLSSVNLSAAAAGCLPSALLLLGRAVKWTP